MFSISFELNFLIFCCKGTNRLINRTIFLLASFGITLACMGSWLSNKKDLSFVSASIDSKQLVDFLLEWRICSLFAFKQHNKVHLITWQIRSFLLFLFSGFFLCISILELLREKLFGLMRPLNMYNNKIITYHNFVFWDKNINRSIPMFITL